MEYDSKSYVLSSDTSALEPYSHSLSLSSRANARTTCSGPTQHSIIPKREDGDGCDIKPLDRKLHARSTTSTIQAGQQPKKQRRKPRSPEDELAILNFPGLRPAELESPRYLLYREKARQKSKDKNQANVWPDDVENAFQLALRVIPPMGRKKKRENGKLCGRNELLMNKILAWTKIKRTRKQISSHIQVLKGLMPDIHEWLKHVTLIEHSSSGAANPSIFDNIDIRALKMSDEEMALYARTHYGDPVQAAYSTAQALPPPVGILGSNAPGHGPFLSRIEFEMYILSPSGERIHNHTSNQAEIGAPSRALEEVCNWRSSYPLLENYYGQGQLDSEIILVESNLSLLSEYPPNGSTLSIGFNVNMAGLAGNERWSTKTEYYENNGQPVDMRAFYALNQIRKTFPWDTPNVFPGSGRSDVKLEIPLQSTWWVQLFTKMAKRKQETNHHPYLSQQEDEWSRRYLQEMSIMQELWVNRESDGASDSRVAIILWKFSQTRAGVAGTTTWRKLKPPPARIKVNSPIQSPAPPLQHSLVLDSALQTLAMPQAVSVNAERFLHKANLFAEDTEGIVTEPRSARDSASPALSLDYTTSFPSSTSTSFPPSVTHGYLSHEESQESACYSQESERSRNGSLDAQYSFAFPHESCYPYQEPGAYNEDLTYISGSQEIESQDQAYYSQQSFDSRPDYHAQSQYDSFNGELTHDTPYSAHNFTGGQIQLSFEPHDIVSNAQIASAPNMAHVPHPSDTQGQTNEEELHPTSQSFPVVESNPVAADQAHHTDFDFSTLESHFTPEEIAAFRAQDSEHHQHGELGELLRSHGEMHDFDHHPLDTTESVEQPLGSAATTRFHDAAFSPI